MKTVEIPIDKPGLREWGIARRALLPMPELSAQLRDRLADLPEWKTARRILLYLAMPGEVSVEELMYEEGEKRSAPDWESPDAATQFYVPRCAPNRRLALHPFIPGETPLRPGPFGIREPDPRRVSEASPEEIDLVVVPALLLTPSGDRLGYGGGYYDRLLPRLRTDCVRVGVLPQELVVSTLPRDPWDAPLDIVTTNVEIYHRPQGKNEGKMASNVRK